MNNRISTIYRYIHTTFTAYYRRLPILLAVGLITFAVTGVQARKADYYASSSRLASGKWAKVKVQQTGMQFISNATLSSMGFRDSSKVNVYGYGGAPIEENLSEIHPDDLPILPVVHTATGILFFGTDINRYNLQTTSDGMHYCHSSNPFSSDSYYFISDVETTPLELSVSPDTPSAGVIVDSFTETLLYEQDLVSPANTGRILLGEDFRSPSTRSFTFQLPDNVGSVARVKTTFATRTTSGTSSLTFTANGKKLPSKSTDVVSPISSSEQFMRYSTIVKDVEDAGASLQYQIQFQASGAIMLARLDYIEVEYTRSMKMRDGQLYFTTNYGGPTRMRLSGTDAGVTVWDVTDPSDIKKLRTSTEGANTTFTVLGGYRKLIAFNSNVSGYTVAKGEAVSNQDIHALENPDLLIISPAEYLAASERLAEHHRRVDGMTVHVLTPETLYNEFSSGTPDVSAFRKALKMWHDRATEKGEEPVRFCLIMSRPTYDYKTSSRNTSWPVIPTWLSDKGVSQTTSYCTDDFIGMLDDSFSPTGFNMSQQKIHVAVGRLPVISVAEADQMVDKIIRYVEEPDLGAWRNNVMIIADDQDNGIHLQQAEKVYADMNSSGEGNRMLYERLYLDSYRMVAASTGNTYPDAKERMLKIWNEGVMYINYIGHASPKEWGHEDMLNWTDINSFSNTRLPFVYAATCEFARYDAEDRSGAEMLWLYPTSGIIATICPNRTVYITQNGTLNSASHRSVFESDKKFGKRIGDIMIDGKNALPMADDNKLRYILIGDPAMALPVPQREVAIDSLMGSPANVAAGADLPIIPARGQARISGHIRKADGSIDDTFSGILSLQIHDAEMPVETNGNGDNGVVSIYNDRKTRLYTGSTRVVNGRWETVVLMPSEIENNYSPARMTFYASADDGREANGACDKFYVYGYDDNAPDDTTGPEITLFALNRDDFADGDLVHTSPVVLANFSDPSGINLSDAGIGHKITLRLDDKRFFEDVNSYYTPNPDDSSIGSVAYPMPELEAGEHTLQLTVWDNANNSSSKSIRFQVGVAKEPVIYDLTTDVNPARENVNFLLSTDRPMAKVDCRVEVFDLNGRTVWRSDDNVSTDVTASLRVPWNLCDASGARVARGIYVYRATVTSPEGTSVTASKKLAVTAP